jgi:hypothetical protein
MFVAEAVLVVAGEGLAMVDLASVALVDDTIATIHCTVATPNVATS